MKKIPAIEIQQPLGVFYACTLTAQELLDVAFPSNMRETVEKYTNRDTDIEGAFFSIIGTQRNKDSTKVRSVRDYIRTGFSCFPNSIILGANITEDGLLVEDDGWYITKEDFRSDNGEIRTFCFINIPDDNRLLASIIDGQHRLEGFRELSNSDPQLKMQLLCSVFIGLPASYQAHIFATINTTQKRVNKNVIYQLYQFDMQELVPIQWSPDTLAVYIARVINSDENSCLYTHLKIGADNLSSTSQEWYVSMASVIDGIIRLISKNPKKDREQMNSISIDKRVRGVLVSDDSPLRDWFIQKKDKDLYDLICFFIELCGNKYIRHDNSIFRKTIGISALFDFLFYIVDKHRTSSFSDIKNRIETALSKSCSYENFKDDYFSVSSKGRGLIKNTLISSYDSEYLLRIKNKEDKEKIKEILDMSSEREKD